MQKKKKRTNVNVLAWFFYCVDPSLWPSVRVNVEPRIWSNWFSSGFDDKVDSQQCWNGCTFISCSMRKLINHMLRGRTWKQARNNRMTIIRQPWSKLKHELEAIFYYPGPVLSIGQKICRRSLGCSKKAYYKVDRFQEIAEPRSPRWHHEDRMLPINTRVEQQHISISRLAVQTAEPCTMGDMLCKKSNFKI